LISIMTRAAGEPQAGWAFKRGSGGLAQPVPDASETKIMKMRVLAAALAVSLLSGASALAQPEPEHDRHGGGEHGGGPRSEPAPPPPRVNSAPVAHAPSPNAPPPSPYRAGPAASAPPDRVRGHDAPGGWQGYAGPRGEQRPWPGEGGHDRGGGGDRNQGWDHNQGFDQGPDHDRGPDHERDRGRGDFHPSFGAPGFVPGGRRPHYDPGDFPREFHPEHRFHWRGQWAEPEGFYYRHWGYGDRLPWGWFDRSFWIYDYYDYELPVPPYGYEWVRVGPDALLVEIDSGLVVETVYGVFY
jgi:Ni/Co efflux regulator RcnB